MIDSVKNQIKSISYSNKILDNLMLSENFVCLVSRLRKIFLKKIEETMKRVKKNPEVNVKTFDVILQSNRETFTYKEQIKLILSHIGE